MAVDKVRSVYVCQACGHQAPRWMGQCPGCAAWNTLVEEAVRTPSKARAGRRASAAEARPRPLREVASGSAIRRSTGIAELDRVLGGGLVQGAIVLLGGDPGIGKSTLALQAAGTLARAGADVLYVTGEESAEQVRMRADRLGLGDAPLFLLPETEMAPVLAEIERRRPALAIVDSIQTLHTADLASAPGSVAQVRETASMLVTHAKAVGTACIVIGHVTKEGALAGPRVLEHLVDTVLYFEGDDTHAIRVLRAVKNRFGSTNEVGVFEMREEGLVEVPNPSAVFLAERPRDAPGSAVLPTLEGSRPVLVEIQALVSRSALAVPRRTAIGLDPGRVALLLAVLEKRAGMRLFDQDVFLNVAGGLRVDEPAADLAVVAAVASSVAGRPLPAEVVLWGEVGLTGEVRSVARAEARAREAEREGFRRCIVPAASVEALRRQVALRCDGVRGLAELLAAVGLG